MLPLEGVLVVAIEQAVAAPLCTSRLCEAGARVIKIERSSGDFSRGYDAVAGGDSSYFLWLNRGKESLVLDFKDRDDAKLLHKILKRADVVVQNLAPGALERSGFGSASLREKYPQLITCDISGYGSNESVASMKAYDFLIQAECGLVSISGGKSDPGRVGVSICDITTGMNAHAGILEALIQQQKSGHGSAIEISLFGTAADWMTVPLLHADYGDKILAPAGLRHPSIAPYGGYTTSDGEIVVIAIQNEREWERFCRQVLGQDDLAADTQFNNNNKRVKNRENMDKLINSVTIKLTQKELVESLKVASVAYGSVNDIVGLSKHPALTRRSAISSSGTEVNFPCRPISQKDAECSNGENNVVPAIGEHSNSIRAEFT